MIIQALVRRYEDTQSAPLGWKKRAVTHALNLSEEGKLIQVIPLEWEDTTSFGGKPKKVMRKRELVLPVSGVRSSGIKGAFLCDDASYMFGMDEKRGDAKFEASKDLHFSLLENVNSPSANAIKAWFDTDDRTERVEQLKIEIPNEKELEKAVFVFQVNGVNVDFDDYDIRTIWNASYSKVDENQGEKIRCLVTGKLDAPERIHEKVKLRGGQSAGSNLVSANAESFTSYSKTKDDRAADIGKYAAFAHVTALNDLLQNEKHRKWIGGDTLVYWAETNSEPEAEAFGDWLDFQPTEEDSDKLSAAMENMATAKHFNFNNCNMSQPFYLLCLSPNAARASVRFFHSDTFGNIMDNLREHYRHLEIVSDNMTKFQYLPFWVILSETTVTKEAGKATPLLGGQLMHSILKGTKYPQTLYNAILTRIRAGEQINQTKAAVIKAVLIKNFKETEVTKVNLNDETSNKPYVLGRLFSVLEQLQNRASDWKLSATIRDKYFASACANPSNVFPTILKLSMHHAAKLENSTFYESLKGKLLSKLEAENPFPTTLGLEDQGKFILGYYHQKQSFFTKNDQNKEANND
ncbi:MAG: type I-C CRISPR-associated protein Cas8c/Csd1 [Defluviitaleaceae bacterium]|nr:type I-C CRISPR-associated protein Cas8c/Csd1 [Defluviitaleaceae bacterium]